MPFRGAHNVSGLLPSRPSSLAGFPPRSVTRGAVPGAGGTFPPPGRFLPAAGPLLPTAARTLLALFRPLLGPREHGPRARDSVAVSTTHGGRRAAPRRRQAGRRWQGLRSPSPRALAVSGER